MAVGRFEVPASRVCRDTTRHDRSKKKAVNSCIVEDDGCAVQPRCGTVEVTAFYFACDLLFALVYGSPLVAGKSRPMCCQVRHQIFLFLLIVLPLP